MIHFDTNFIIQVIVSGSPASVKFRAWASANEICNVCAVAWSEFSCGPLDAGNEAIARNLFPNPEPMLAADAELAASLHNQTGRRSRSLADCMIAAVAIRCRANFATINAADFRPFTSHGLVLA